jgi:molybdopterin synthase catalytic subunit
MISTGVVDRAIDPVRLLEAAAHPGCGATVLFVGTVRGTNEGRSVSSIAYSAYRGMAEAELDRICREAVDRYPELRLAAEHRLGSLAVGEASIAIAAAHPHRAEAFEACRYVIEEAKRRLPIWKNEEYADGTSDWVGASHSDSRGVG